MIKELGTVAFVRILLGHCRVNFPCKKIVYFLRQCHVTFPFLEKPSFIGRFLQNVVIVWFSDSDTQKMTQQSDGRFDATNNTQLLFKILKQEPFHFRKYIHKICCEQRVLNCSPKSQPSSVTKD